MNYSRRHFLEQMGTGFGTVALSSLLQTEGVLAGEAGPHTLQPRQTHSRPRAKAIIQLFQNGGVSQMDVFDPKPELTRQNGKPHPNEVETFHLNNKNILINRKESYLISSVISHI